MRKLTPAVVALVALLLLGAACGRTLYGREDLEHTLSKHYLELRWGRIANAAGQVHEELRPAFVEDWEKRAQGMQLQDLEVVAIEEADDGESAVVTVRMSWVEESTMRLFSAKATQKWVRTEEGWRAAELLEVPSGS